MPAVALRAGVLGVGLALMRARPSLRLQGKSNSMSTDVIGVIARCGFSLGVSVSPVSAGRLPG